MHTCIRKLVLCPKAECQEPGVAAVKIASQALAFVEMMSTAMKLAKALKPRDRNKVFRGVRHDTAPHKLRPSEAWTQFSFRISASSFHWALAGDSLPAGARQELGTASVKPQKGLFTHELLSLCKIGVLND